MLNPTNFGSLVLELMRERGYADSLQLELNQQDVNALRRHFTGQRAMNRDGLPNAIAEALELGDEDRTRLAMAFLFDEAR